MLSQGQPVRVCREAKLRCGITHNSNKLKLQLMCLLGLPCMLHYLIKMRYYYKQGKFIEHAQKWRLL